MTGKQAYRPQMTSARLAPTETVEVTDEFGRRRRVEIAGESPLTLFVDDREIVTLMTLGGQPEALALGYLRTQRLVEAIDEIRSVRVDWSREAVYVQTHNGVDGWDRKLARRTVTTGCGQGTVFSCTIDRLYDRRLAPGELRQSQVYALLDALGEQNRIYRSAGAVHGCALCQGPRPLHFVEDVGRHNAADAIAGHMWLEDIDGSDKTFYTTGRLTSEIVMKVAMMGIPVLLSRSGVTQMGLELARDLCVTMIARAKGRHFLVFNGAENLRYDAPPAPSPGSPLANLPRAAGE